jgi:hypothetical protein
LPEYFSASRIHRATTIALVILPGVHILTLHGMISDAVLMGRPQVLLIYYSSFIGMAFSMAFFAPLWSRLPIATEGEFLLWRFSGPWAVRLQVMRSVLLGVVVIPILLGLLLLPLGELLTDALHLPQRTARILLAATLALGASINTFQQRILIDRLIGIVALVLAIPLAIRAIGGLRALDAAPLENGWSHWLGQLSGVDVLVPALVLWWFAHIIDLPTMTGQKLLASRSPKAGARGAVIASLAMVLIGGIFLALPLALGYTPAQGSFFAFLGRTLHGSPWLAVLTGFYLCTGVFLLLNLQHWAGSQLDGNLIKHHVRLVRSRWTGIAAMLLTSLLGFIVVLVQDSTLSTYWDRIMITAGVGPVFILRWYLPRVTARVQFTAMIAAMAYAVLWDVLAATERASDMIARWAAAISLPTHILQIGAIGLATLLTAAIPYCTASGSDIAHGRERLHELHGGRPALRGPFRLALGLCLLYFILATLPSLIGLAR